MDSTTGLVIQFTGVFLIAVLSLLLRRTLKTPASNFWTAAWISLSFGLISLSAAFIYGQFTRLLFGLYFLAEYIFGFLLIFGCLSLNKKFQPTFGHKLYFLPFLLAAIVLPFLSTDFNLIFNLHSLLLASLFAVALSALKNSNIKSFGWRVMRTVLALLALDFFHYFVIFTLLQFEIRLSLPESYLLFNPIIDLILEIQLGFGMVIVLLEQVLQETRIINKQLRRAHQKLEQTAQIDSLTTAFNRHAFYGFLKRRGEEETKISGCVGFFDIDDLKPINDRFGHSVGDMAIRAVVCAIRKVMRAEDLIYRWGGDEFFVIMVSMNAEMAYERMGELERLLTGVFVEGAKEPLTIGVSYGFEDFSDISNLEQAVKKADEEMYRRKQERKQSKLSNSEFVPQLQEHRPTVEV